MRKIAGFLACLLVTCACSTRAATFYSDPEKGQASNDGSAAAPWGALESVIKNGQLAKLKGGDMLLLRSGFHGEARFEGVNEAMVTIASEPGQSPRLARLEIEKGKNWTVKGLAISASFAKDRYKGNMVTIGERGESSELVVEDCFVFTEEDSSKWGKDEWMKANSGILMGRHGKNLTLRNNYVLNTRFGICMTSFDSLCEGCVVANFSADGIRMTRDGETAQYNVVKNAFVSMGDGDENHDDAIQCFLFNKGTGMMRNLTVRGNILLNPEGETKHPHFNTMQAIGFFDGPLVDFLVEDNVVNTIHWHGVALYDAQNSKVLNNTCWTSFDEKPKPWVMLGSKLGQSKGNTVKGNHAFTFNFKADGSVTAEGNEKITEEYYKQRLKEAEETIAAKFGRYHPVAKYGRLGMEKGENAPAGKAMAAAEKPAGKSAAEPAAAGTPEAPSSAASAPDAPAVAVADDALKVWKERLSSRVAEATQSGARPEAFVKVFGKQAERLKLAAADANELKVVVQGNTMPFAWNKLDREDCYNVMRSVADESKPGDLAQQAVWAMATGRRDAAEEFLAKARQAGAENKLVAEAATLMAAK
ncbi:MAG: right-handed parallel beta-helix repeat-containing protein [Planctomycetota bacterium]|nr:right-handed parallel beta-helix repeat-containing protein [Planctomycetota bacterium]